MRPRKITTLKDLKDFITQAESFGALPSTLLYDVDLMVPTAVLYSDPPFFISFEYWTDKELEENAAHNDRLGTPPHFVS